VGKKDQAGVVLSLTEKKYKAIFKIESLMG
jgi:hypothetical protein